MNNENTRRRDSGEFFGLERALWEDRQNGTLCAGYLARLAAAEAELSAAMPGAAGSDPAVNAGLLAAVQAAREVLEAAKEAVRDRGEVSFPAGLRA